MSEDDETVLPIVPGPLVLVVADDLTHRSIVSRMVRTLGLPVRSCTGSAAALRFLREHPREVRLLLADLALERMDGGELAERARDLDPRVRVVLMVGLQDPHLDDLMAGYHDVPVVPKPVSFADLAGVLQDMFGAMAVASGDPASIARPRRRRSSGQHRI